ncbi:MAG: hydrolase [Lentisphaerae bacterium RIFOXYA12_FULL_48_11]|nr:MAG: hydrolase [Lentisphaerae bacterium RIFOXYA12_FULL_48_11]
MLKTEQTVLVLVDIQGKLAEIMHEKEMLYQNVRRLIMAARALSLPVIWMEQIPEKMGQTVQEIRELLTAEQPISKKSFSGCGEPAFMTSLKATGRTQVLLAGIESHVCVYQTASDLAGMGYEPYVVSDAVSSRTLSNKKTGLERSKEAGAKITSVESALFEMMKTSEHPAFKEILKIVR